MTFAESIQPDVFHREDRLMRHPHIAYRANTVSTHTGDEPCMSSMSIKEPIDYFILASIDSGVKLRSSSHTTI